MLSKTERDYLQGKIEKIDPNYKRRLHHSIKLKVIQAFKDFPLLLNLPKKKQIILFSDDRLVGDAVKAILTMWQQAQGYIDEQQNSTYHAKRIGELMMRLEEAKISYNVYKLNRDSDYRTQMGRRLRQEKHRVTVRLVKRK
jgi:hypothetical protein